MDKYNENIVIDFEPISRRVFYSDKNFYQILIKIGIQIQSLCGGKGKCGKCKILIQQGLEYLTPPDMEEKKFLKEDEIIKGWRLACRTKINKEQIKVLEAKNKPQFRIFLPNELVLEDFKILTAGVNREVALNPAVQKLYLEIKKPTLEEPVSDYERLLSALSSKYDFIENLEHLQINVNIINKLGSILRNSDHKITVTLWNGIKIINIEPNDTSDNNFGIAFDIGTTTVVGYLINLNNGKIYAVDSKLNKQTAYGEDVITRLSYISNHEDGLFKLNNAIIDVLNEIILKTCSKANIKTNQINEATIVGNSVMHHIFLGLNPMSIGLSPYVPLVQKGLNTPSKDLKLNINDQGNVYTAPLIAGFVGADTMGVIVASNIETETDLTLAIDIGTNGELIVGNQKVLATGSCAAGSALEGAHIANGMRAAAGAIDTIKIDPNNLDVIYTTIKNKKPIGICGSGLIDATAEMLKSKVLTRSGNFNKNYFNHEKIRIKDGKIEFVLVRKEDTSIDRDITISQHDIRQIQMAKGAFYSGAQVILKELQKTGKTDDLNFKQIFLAGAFGNYINKTNAKFIGMIPDIPDEKIFQIGNAAGIGSQHCLLNLELREKVQNLLKRIYYIEISIKKEFQREYAEAMYFPHLNLEHFPSLKIYKDIVKR